jgi:hypothetical protein
LTPHQVDGAVAAANHLLGLGLSPLFNTDTLRGIWRRGHRDLAVRLARLAGVA